MEDIKPALRRFQQAAADQSSCACPHRGSYATERTHEVQKSMIKQLSEAEGRAVTRASHTAEGELQRARELPLAKRSESQRDREAAAADLAACQGKVRALGLVASGNPAGSDRPAGAVLMLQCWWLQPATEQRQSVLQRLGPRPRPTELPQDPAPPQQAGKTDQPPGKTARLKARSGRSGSARQRLGSKGHLAMAARGGFPPPWQHVT